jgi:hypothetical protein
MLEESGIVIIPGFLQISLLNLKACKTSSGFTLPLSPPLPPTGRNPEDCSNLRLISRVVKGNHRQVTLTIGPL